MQLHYESSARIYSFEPKSIWPFRLSPILLLGIALFFPLPLLGAEQSDPQAPYVVPQTQKSDRYDSMEDSRNYLSEKITNFASNIDRFFGGDRHYQESNPSVIQLSVARGDGYGSSRNFDLAAKLNLRLPVTEGRLRLLVETDPEENIMTGATTTAGAKPTSGATTVQSNAALPKNKVVAPKSLAVAVRVVAAEENVWNFNTDAGLQFPTPPKPFVRSRGSYSTPMGDWRLKAVESVYWFNKLGAGETTQLDLERILSNSVLFRSTTNATYLNDKKNFDLRQDLSFYHTLNDRTALLYQASAIGVSNPQLQVTDYVALLFYRYRLHKEWLFFEASPQLHFPREKNFKANPAFYIRLEILFDDSR